MFHATGGRVTDAPLTGAEAIRDPKFKADLGIDYVLVNHENDTNGCCTILSIEYELSNFSGNTLTFRASSGCDNNSDVDWQVSDVGDHWNDDFSSYVTLNQCGVKHFENINFGGAATQWDTGDCCMGVMNNATSSLKWR